MRIGIIQIAESVQDVAKPFLGLLKKMAVTAEFEIYKVPYLIDAPIGAEKLIKEKECDLVTIILITDTEDEEKGKEIEEFKKAVMDVEIATSAHIFYKIISLSELSNTEKLMADIQKFATLTISFLYKKEQLDQVVEKPQPPKEKEKEPGAEELKQILEMIQKAGTAKKGKESESSSSESQSELF